MSGQNGFLQCFMKTHCAPLKMCFSIKFLFLPFVEKMFQKIFALILCIGLLVPIMEKSLHALKHSADLHCTSSDKHFHEKQHSCSVCDYELNSPDVQSIHIDFQVYAQKFEYVTQYQLQFSSSEFLFTASRAPPAHS